jgi:hypothetical protein
MPPLGKHRRWAEVRSQLDTFDRQGLLGLVRDLYEANAANRRFLRARFLPTGAAIEEYRQLVSDAVFPDPFSKRPVRLRDASATITEYGRSTGDVAGSVDLMLTFVEAGTEQAADLGYGDGAYFSALVRQVDAVVNSLGALSAQERALAVSRLDGIRNRAKNIGWGYGDYLEDIVAELRADEASLAGTKSAMMRSNKT